MTIYKPKTVDRKADKKDSPTTKVVIAEDVQPLAAPGVVRAPATVNVLVLSAARRRQQNLVLTCMVVLVIIVISVVSVGGYKLYHHLMDAHEKLTNLHVDKAEIHYYEYQMVNGNAGRRRVDGYFAEDIEVECSNGAYERLDVPSILNSRRSTVIHDFEMNFTAVVDRDHELCLVMPLNRTTVQPPKSLLDLLIKYRSGYYLPNAEVVRENYKVQQPAVADLQPFGFYIWLDCHSYQTYRLVHDDVEPRLLSKRSACEMAGDSYCLGDAGSNKMLCFKLSGCV